MICYALQGTNISPQNGILKMIFRFPRWDMLIPLRVYISILHIDGFQKKSLQKATVTNPAAKFLNYIYRVVLFVLFHWLQFARFLEYWMGVEFGEGDQVDLLQPKLRGLFGSARGAHKSTGFILESCCFASYVQLHPILLTEIGRTTGQTNPPWFLCLSNGHSLLQKPSFMKDQKLISTPHLWGHL